MAKVNTSFKITNFQLLGAVILVHIESDELPGKIKLLINKLRFEEYVTEGKGFYDATFSTLDHKNEQRDCMILCPVAGYWNETPEAIRNDLYSYIAADAGLQAYTIQQLTEKSEKFQVAFDLCLSRINSCTVSEHIESAEKLVNFFCSNFSTNPLIQIYSTRLEHALTIKRLDIKHLEAKPARLYVSILFNKKHYPPYS